MDQSFIETIAKDYKERVKRVFLFEPLQELGRKNRTDQNGKVVDIKSLGLFTLLFFFEMKLMREKKSGVSELIQFLQKFTHGTYELDDKQMDEIARIIIGSFRPGTGKKKTHLFFNWETHQEDQLDFSYIKATDFDVKTNRQYYTLDDDGLELVFATKEYFQEFQLSIHQLMLRKLLEKGEFVGALRQINEMRMDVETIHERMVKLEHEIKRSIVSIETQKRFMEVIKDRNFRLGLENEEFQELQQFVSETRSNYYYQPNPEKEKEAYELLLKIEKELSVVHSQHRELLNQSFLLKKNALEAAEESLYYIGVDTFNFDQDIVSRIISTPLPLESMKGVFAPFLTIEKKETWSLLSIFAPQSWSEEDHSSNNAVFAKIDEDEAQEKYANLKRKLYGEMMKDLLEVFEGQVEWTLSEWVTDLQIRQHPWLQTRSFYDFLILCHQRSPIFQEKEREEESASHLLDDALELLHHRKLVIEDLTEIIKVNDRFKIQNMHFHLWNPS
nr:replicative DNA helicase [Lysinibacillus timonensis]